ncbi:MAG: quinate/shikimate dehydrogenase, partial [Lachnospiraceae bacterium]
GKSTEHARQVINQLTKQTACKINLFDYSDESVIKKELLTSRILTNGTNVGMAPDTDRSLITSADFFHPDLIVSDVIYNPRETKMMEIAKSQGCSCFNGLYMLLYQGAEAFTLWTGKQMPVELVKERYFDEPEACSRTAQ